MTKTKTRGETPDTGTANRQNNTLFLNTVSEMVKTAHSHHLTQVKPPMNINTQDLIMITAYFQPESLRPMINKLL